MNGKALGRAFCFLGLCAFVSCKTRESYLLEPNDPSGIKILKEQEAAPANLSNATVSSHLSEDDKRQIALLVGRLGGISHEVRMVDVCWNEHPVAAKVMLDCNLWGCRGLPSHGHGASVCDFLTRF